MLFCQYIVTNCHISLVMTAWPKFKEYFQELMNNPNYYLSNQSKELKQCTEVCFASFLSGGFTTMAVMNPLERILAKRTSKQCNMYLVHVVYGSTRLGIWVSWLNRTGRLDFVIYLVLHMHQFQRYHLLSDLNWLQRMNWAP